MPTLAPHIIVTSTTSVNIRAGPGTVYPISGTVTSGDRLLLLARTLDGKWWQVEFEDTPAWIYAPLTSANRRSKEVPTVSVTPIAPAYTPLPTPTSTPTLSAPELIAPEEQASFHGHKAEVVLSWSVPNRALAEDEYHVVVITHRDGTGFMWVKENHVRAEEWLYGYGPKIQWQVVVAGPWSGEANANPSRLEASPYSPARVFYWLPGPGTGTGPTPTPTKPPTG